MSEGLGRMLTHARAQESLKGLTLHEHTPITHQQFVDDNILLGHPSIQEAISIENILSTFSKASGVVRNIAPSMDRSYSSSLNGLDPEQMSE